MLIFRGRSSSLSSVPSSEMSRYDSRRTGGRSTAGAPAQRPAGQGTSLRIICPTYWYPQHATDTQATYVHDINRHLVRRGHSVTVVTPGDSSLAGAESFDGVEVVRFPHRAARRPDLRPGGPEPGQSDRARWPAWPSWPTTWRRSTGRRWRWPGARRRCDPRPLGDPHRTGGGAGGSTARPAEHHHHARGRRVCESGAGVRFPHPVVRAPGAALDPRARRARLPRSPTIAGSTRSGPAPRPSHPPGVQWHRSPALQSGAGRCGGPRASAPT